MTGLETAFLIGSTALTAIGKISEGVSASNALNAQAAAEKRQANEERAASQREAVARSAEATRILSRQQAVAAASGGSATDPTVLKIVQDTAGQGAYQTASALYEGDSKAAGLEDSAEISRMKARQAKVGSFIGAGTTMLSGLSNYSSLRKTSTLGSSELPYAPYSQS